MKVAFICGPYRAKTISGVVANIRYAERFAKLYWKEGYVVICPHLNSALFDGILPDTLFLKGAKELLKRSGVIVLIPGWENSKGSIDELQFAKKLGKEIIEESHVRIL